MSLLGGDAGFRRAAAQSPVGPWQGLTTKPVGSHGETVSFVDRFLSTELRVSVINWKQVGSGILFAIGMLCLGITAGGLVVGAISNRGGMGWDRIANTLSGVLVGMIAAAVLTGAIVGRLTNRQRIAAAVVSVVASGVLVAIMQRTTGPSP